MTLNSRRLVAGFAIVVFLTIGLLGHQAHAENTKIRFAYLNVIDLLPLYVAETRGYFNDEGIDIDWISLTSGSAVATAVASNSADVGFAGVVPLILARLQNNPFKFFAGLNFEQAPNKLALSIVARTNSKINSASDLRGKTLGLVAYANQCELLARVALARVGLTLSDVHVAVVPFPQTEAALESGNLDAACEQDPFLTIALHDNVARIIAQGQVFDASKPYLNAGLFSSEQWMVAHPKLVKGFIRAVSRGVEAAAANQAEARQILAERLHLAPAVAQDVRLVIYSTALHKAEIQPVIDSLVKTGMIKKAFDAGEIIQNTAQ